ncbi:hypothetical protein GOBAR_DD11549 [Gossypium barbadense]|nr:hypothetical protein GOBAR_DD11549 [Gossypium barbadense]
MKEWVRNSSYDPKPRCTPCAALANSRRSSRACPPCAAPSSLAVAAEFVASTRTTALPGLILAFINGTFASHIPLLPNTSGGIQDMMSMSAYNIHSN